MHQWTDEARVKEILCFYSVLNKLRQYCKSKSCCQRLRDSSLSPAAGLSNPSSKLWIWGETSFCRSRSLEGAVDRCWFFSACTSASCTVCNCPVKRKPAAGGGGGGGGGGGFGEVAWCGEEAVRRIWQELGWLVCRFCSGTGGGWTIWAGADHHLEEPTEKQIYFGCHSKDQSEVWDLILLHLLQDCL